MTLMDAFPLGEVGMLFVDLQFEGNHRDGQQHIKETTYHLLLGER